MNKNIDVSAETLILKLDSLDVTLDLVGGKGTSLARLAAASLPVPPGFHITTYAYRRFTEENHITDPIISAAKQTRADDPSTWDSASEQIQSLILKGVIHSDIEDSIR